MSALEDLAQAILDGRVSLTQTSPGRQPTFRIKVEPAPEPQPRPVEKATIEVCGAWSLDRTYQCAEPKGHQDFLFGKPVHLAANGHAFHDSLLSTGQDDFRTGVCGVRSGGEAPYRCTLRLGHPGSTGRNQDHFDGTLQHGFAVFL